MYFESLQAAVLMDGHGAYVWGAYGASLLLLALMLAAPLRRERRLLRELRGEQRRAERRAAAGAPGR